MMLLCYNHCVTKCSLKSVYRFSARPVASFLGSLGKFSKQRGNLLRYSIPLNHAGRVDCFSIGTF